MGDRKGELTWYTSGRHQFTIGTVRQSQGWAYWVLHLPEGASVGDQVIPEPPAEYRGHFGTEEEALEAARRAADGWVESRIGTEDARLHPPQPPARLDIGRDARGQRRPKATGCGESA